MATLTLNQVSVDFPIYEGRARSLKHRLLGGAATGGAIRQTQSTQVTVIRALERIDLRLQDGDRLALIGHNGAGKSTLLRVMAGIFEPTEGSVAIGGSVVPMFNISLGMDLESTGYENILLRGLYLGLPRAEIERRVDEIAEFSGLGEFLSLPMRTYSTGMRMRLAFSVSTAIRPDILLVDEGLGTADAAFTQRARGRIEAFAAEASILVLAAHSIPLIRAMCNQAALLNHGRIDLIGPIDDVIAAYRAAGAMG
jgi:ABC-2 type transport system ATP-binding protein